MDPVRPDQLIPLRRARYDVHRSISHGSATALLRRPAACSKIIRPTVLIIASAFLGFKGNLQRTRPGCLKPKRAKGMEHSKHADLAGAFYAALAAGDRAQLDALLHPQFTGRIAEGMPFGIGGVHDSPAAMRRNAWGAIARHFEARAEPDRFLDLVDGRLLVTGPYRGPGKQGGAPLDAAFAP